MSIVDAGGSDFTDCRWLVFDAVGTLIQPKPSVASAYHAVATRHGSQLTISEIGDRFRRAFRRSETDSFPNGPAAETPWRSSDQIEIARWRWIVGQVIPDVSNLDLCFSELWDHFARPTSWICFDDVHDSLRSLDQAGYRLAIASNFDSRLHPVCDGHSALKPIQQRFVSSETGFRKPAADFYSAVIAHCACPARQILMVGDDQEHDVAGPVGQGMQALLLDRSATTSSRCTIRSLKELVSLLQDGIATAPVGGELF